MARLPRSALSEVGAFHITGRGVARSDIFRDDFDRGRFVSLLGLAARRWRWNVSAYCLMTNHFHLLVTTNVEHLSRGMHLLGFRYAQRFNERHGRVGHLFQDRFAAREIAADEHFVAACDYVFQNPVRAGLCEHRDDWPWIGGEVLADLR